MKTLAKVSKGKLVFRIKEEFEEFARKYDGKEVIIDLQPHRNERTQQQNRALHLWFSQIAKALNDAGFDMRKFIRPGIDIPWTDHSVKEQLWRPVQETMLGKESTTKITTDEIDKIYEVVNRAIATRTGVHIPFPSIENMHEL